MKEKFGERAERNDEDDDEDEDEEEHGKESLSLTQGMGEDVEE